MAYQLILDIDHMYCGSYKMATVATVNGPMLALVLCDGEIPRAFIPMEPKHIDDICEFLQKEKQHFERKQALVRSLHVSATANRGDVEK